MLSRCQAVFTKYLVLLSLVPLLRDKSSKEILLLLKLKKPIVGLLVPLATTYLKLHVPLNMATQNNIHSGLSYASNMIIVIGYDFIQWL